ncbi:MAG: bifunctional pyr operon transcriptional regulator/uracil phosphoribosyltransferase PyrR [Thermodesulfobacteriota bacterium]
MKKKTLINSKEIDRKILRIVHEIIEKNSGVNDIAVIGIKSRGEYIGKRITDKLNKLEKKKVPFGTLDITLYRDDLRNNLNLPELKGTDINFDIDKLKIILVDDVLYTGRTIRAAIDAIMALGRPSNIQLAVLIDRGLRELPIQPDFAGLVIETSNKEKIEVHLKEHDKKEEVVLIRDD